jgi:hypothetical protein
MGAGSEEGGAGPDGGGASCRAWETRPVDHSLCMPCARPAQPNKPRKAPTPMPPAYHHLQADSIWCDSGDSASSPSLVGRLLIRRLELESQLVWGARCRAARAAAEPTAALPPLELPELPPFGLWRASVRGKGPADAGTGSDTCGGGGGGGGGGGTADGTAAGGGGGSGGDGLESSLNDSVELLSEVPDAFICPLSQQVMTDPVTTPGECRARPELDGRSCGLCSAWGRPASTHSAHPAQLCARRPSRKGAVSAAPHPLDASPMRRGHHVPARRPVGLDTPPRHRPRHRSRAE